MNRRAFLGLLASAPCVAAVPRASALAATTTGRFSSSSPNAQNIPRRCYAVGDIHAGMAPRQLAKAMNFAMSYGAPCALLHSGDLIDGGRR